MGIINLLTCNSAGHLRPFGTEGSLTQPSLAAQRRRLVGKCVGTYGSRSKGIADEILSPFGRPPLRAQETRSLVGAWRRIAVVVALGAALFESDNAEALDVGEVAPAPSLQWCLLQRDGSSDHPACYENMLACVLARHFMHPAPKSDSAGYGGVDPARRRTRSASPASSA